MVVRWLQRGHECLWSVGFIAKTTKSKNRINHAARSTDPEYQNNSLIGQITGQFSAQAQRSSSILLSHWDVWEHLTDPTAQTIKRLLTLIRREKSKERDMELNLRTVGILGNWGIRVREHSLEMWHRRHWRTQNTTGNEQKVTVTNTK